MSSDCDLSYVRAPRNPRLVANNLYLCFALKPVGAWDKYINLLFSLPPKWAAAVPLWYRVVVAGSRALPSSTTPCSSTCPAQPAPPPPSAAATAAITAMTRSVRPSASSPPWTRSTSTPPPPSPSCRVRHETMPWQLHATFEGQIQGGPSSDLVIWCQSQGPCKKAERPSRTTAKQREQTSGVEFTRQNNPLKNRLRICLRLLFDSRTCLNYLFLDFFQYSRIRL